MKKLKLAIAVVIITSISACSSSSEESTTTTVENEAPASKLLTKAEYGDKYPFKIDSLTLMCKNGGQVIVWKKGTPNAWAVNGNALQVAGANGWGKVKDASLWNDKPLGFVVQEGLALCN